jgi:hypothetical protein
MMLGRAAWEEIEKAEKARRASRAFMKLGTQLRVFDEVLR